MTIEQRDAVMRGGPEDPRRIHEVAVVLDVTQSRPCFRCASAAPTGDGAPKPTPPALPPSMR